MKMNIVFLFILTVLTLGCTSTEYQLGQSVAQMKAEQIYNPGAAKENQGYIPDGQGERIESSLSTYTGKSDDSLSGTSSQVLDDF
ncbi:hypothetical protein [Vibrio salinus]|uniref:hypothetical protein n=1 Tax=Vibrio salinus TaxID=2899784 RepID=UPI001E381D0C|nr:hypothetical protein [Vibrio salinus]MCE0494316.1 hypothetical protein [Vibrio salinus]